MSGRTERLRGMVRRVLEGMNAELPESQRREWSDTMPLVGQDGAFDSLDLVDLVMRLQQAITAEFGVPVAVAGEALLRPEDNPFRTVPRLIDYLGQLLEVEQGT